MGKEEKEKKAKKQFMMFQELVSFAKKAEAKKEILAKMAVKMEKQMKGKFVAFKMCMTEGKCEKSESGEMGSMQMAGSSEEEEESREKEMEGKRMRLFMEMMGMMEKNQGESGEESAEDSSEEEEGMNMEGMKKTMQHLAE